MVQLHEASTPGASYIASLLQVVDSAVLKFPKAVTHFSPGSHASMPEQTTSFPNVFIAGDWVKNIDHGANGLSQVSHLVDQTQGA